MQVNRGRMLTLVSTGALVVFGLAVLASAQAEGSTRLLKQVVWVAAGAVCGGAAVYMGTEFFFRWAYALAAASVLILGAVLLSRPVFGVRAWFDLYLFTVQPAELARVGLVVFTAAVLGGWGRPKRLSAGEPAPGLRDVGLAAGMTGLMIVMVLAEPDVGVALGMVFIFGGCVFCSGLSKRVLAAGLGAAVLLAAATYAFALTEHQKQRMTAWVSPEQHERDAAWQMNRSRLAVGSGGLWGKGWGRGDVNRLGLLPVKDSDFIFAVIAEELGFVAVAGLVAAYAALVSGCFLLAGSSRDRPYGLLCAATGTYFGAQAALNMGVAMGVLPTTGVTLPFISYGGSSMLSNMVLAGLVLSGGKRQMRVGEGVEG